MIFVQGKRSLVPTVIPLSTSSWILSDYFLSQINNDSYEGSSVSTLLFNDMPASVSERDVSFSRFLCHS